jgi:acetolactate synthase-1/2/3 large subunit
MHMTGSNILLECFRREGVEFIFGFPGGVIIDLYDKMPNYPEIRHILVRHEQAAVHAADGYARTAGKVGVCLATSGPGATNTVTGIATAYCDSIPLVIITGQVPTPLIGNDAFQEVDITGITRPITKHNFILRDIKKMALTVRQAFHLARTGRPGPVLIDMPTDVLRSATEFIWPEQVKMRTYVPNYRPHANQLKRALDIMLKAKKPLILSGGGVIMSGASEQLREIATLLNCPVTSTLMGLGAFPSESELWLGMPGMHGTFTANKAITNADVILAVGVRFDDRVTGRVSAFAPNAQIVHIDIDPTSIHKNVTVAVPVVADCQLALRELLKRLQTDGVSLDADHNNAWLKTIDEWKKQNPVCTKMKGKSGALRPQRVIEAVAAITGGDAIITTEVGQHQMWVAQFYPFNQPRTLLTSGGLGTMGYGLPAAVGAQLAMPGKLVIDIAGDGSIQMNIQELITAVHNRLPVKVVILNNGFLGMVRQWQELFWKKNYVGTDISAQPDFVQLAKAYGAEGYLIQTEADLAKVLPKALKSSHTAIIDVRIEREENVYPMVPAGGGLDEMLLA